MSLYSAEVFVVFQAIDEWSRATVIKYMVTVPAPYRCTRVAQPPLRPG